MNIAEIRAYIKCLDDDCPDGFGTIMVDRQKIIALLKRLATLEAAVGKLPKLSDAYIEDVVRLVRTSTPLPTTMVQPLADALADLLKLRQGMK